MEKPNTLAKELCNWMGNLPDELKNIPITQLAIPGAHDSMTYNVNSSSELAPDADSFLQHSSWLGPLVRNPAVKWSITQNHDVTSQLEHGIRYLDLRFATKRGTNTLYFCHGYYSGPINRPLNEINDFLNKHPQEIVILDFQHFYSFYKSDHTRLQQCMDSIFGSKVLKNPGDYNAMTVKYFNTKSIQVICIYRDSASDGMYWPGKDWPTPWPNTTDSGTLFRKLNYGINNRSMDKGFVSQCVLTPDGDYIFRNLFYSLVTTCGTSAHGAIISWLKNQKPGNGKLNVSIKDFVDLGNWAYTRTVVDLNLKLLD